MEQSSRLFICLLCRTQVVICSHCDRGQVYCSKSCSMTARKASCRLAEKCYQRTFKGKRNHSQRQRRYIMRKKEKVTDQGSPSPIPNALLPLAKNKAKQTVNKPLNNKNQCCFCGCLVTAWLRSGFLRHQRQKPVRKQPFLRPP
jgi:hypothetical protein